MNQVWTGPREEDLAPDGLSLRGPVPPERWPCGPPDHHEACCRLHRMADQGISKLYCDCRASDASDTDYGVGHWPGRRTVDDPARVQGSQATHGPGHETSIFPVGGHWEATPATRPSAPKPSLTVRQINAITRAADGRNVYLIRERLGEETVQRVTRARTRGRETEVLSLATGNWLPVLPERGDRLEVR